MNQPEPKVEDVASYEPYSLDEVSIGKLLIALAAGLSQREAGAWVGCSQATVHRLVRCDSQFLKELEYYSQLSRLHPYLCIYRAAAESWHGAACLVEKWQRRHGQLTTDRLIDAFRQVMHQTCDVRLGKQSES